MAELNAQLTLTDNFSAQIKSAIDSTDSFQQAVLKTKRQIEDLSRQRYEATITARDEATQQITRTKKALNDIKTNVAIMIGAKDAATDSVNRIKGHVKLLVDKPYNLVIDAVDKTKSVISNITNSIFSLKTLAAGIVFGSAAKKGFDWTIGNAMDNEDYSATLNTVLHSKDKGKEALKWSYDDAAKTPFNASEVVSGVTQLATSGLDYTKYLNPLGDASAAMNRPLSEAMEAMAKLKAGQNGIAVEMFRNFGIGNSDWTNAGANFSKNGELQVDDPQKAVDMVTKIIEQKYPNLMEAKSNTAHGMLSNMGDNISAMGRGLAGIDDDGQMMEGGLFDNFKKQLVNIGPLIENMGNSNGFKKLQTDIGNLATAGGDKLTEFLKGFQDPEVVQKYEDSFKDFITDVKSGINTAKEFGKSMIEIMNELKPVIDMVVSHPKLFADLFIGFELGKVGFSIVKTITDIKTEFGPLLTAIRTFASGSSGSLSGVKSLFSSISSSILSGAKSIPGHLSTITNTLRIWVGTIGTVLKGNLVKAFSSIGSSIISGIKAIPSGLTTVVSVFKTLGSTIGSVVGSIAKVVGGTLMTVIRVATTGIVTAIRTVVTAMIANPIGAIITAIVAVCALLYEAWIHDWGGIREKTQVVIDFVKEKIAAIPEVFQKVKDKVLEFVDYLKQKWQEVKDFFAHPIDATVNYIKNGTSPETEAKNQNAADAMNMKPWQIGGKALGTNYWEGGLTWVGENGPELINLNKGAKVIPNRQSMNMVNTMADNPTKLTTLPTDFSKTGEQIPKSLSKGIKKTSDIAQDSMTKMSQDLLQTFGTGITDNAKYTTKATNDLSTNVQGIFTTLGKQSNPLGKNVSDGLGQGIKDSMSNVTDMAKTLTDKVIETFKSGFDIHSPSRVMHEIGGHVMQGFINGLSSKDLKSFADKNVKSVVGAFGSATNLPGGVADWLTQALMATGTPLSWLQGLMRLVQAESGGDPNEVNNVSVGGEYATGLLQTLPSTFKEYMQQGMNNILNPVDNAAAAINYIKSRYGDVYNTPLFKGGSYAGYATGTEYATPGYHWVGEKGPELMKFNGGEKVLNHKDSQKATAGGDIKVYVKIEGNVMSNEEYFDQCGEHIAKKIVTVLDNNM